MKLQTVITARKIVASIYKEKISVKLAYKFMKFIEATKKDEDFFNDRLREIVEDFGERDEKNELVSTKGGGIKVAAEKQEECIKKTQELDNTEIDDPNITFTLEELSELKLSISDISALNPFIIEE